jgi:hypothetical protein
VCTYKCPHLNVDFSVIFNEGLKERDENLLNEPITIGGNCLPMLLDDPLFYQDLGYIEKCQSQAPNRDIDLTLLRPSWSFLVIGIKRFYQLYKSGQISIRLKPGRNYNRNKPIVLAIYKEDYSQFASRPIFTDSVDIKGTFNDDFKDPPCIVQELLSNKSLEDLDSDKRYVFLYRDGIVREF